LIIRKNGKYFLSSFGKIIYEAQMIIGISIQNYWKLKAVDSIDPSSASPQLPTEEYDKLIASLFESDDLKDILLDHKNKDIEGDKKEQVHNNRELMLSASKSTQFDR
jgi:hypothetical protein